MIALVRAVAPVGPFSARPIVWDQSAGVDGSVRLILVILDGTKVHTVFITDYMPWGICIYDYALSGPDNVGPDCGLTFSIKIPE